jgi:hypothetical protein
MSVRVARNALVDARKELLYRWERTRDAWDDQTRAAFQKKYIDPLEQATMHAIKGLEQLEELMVRAQKECADEPRSLLG